MRRGAGLPADRQAAPGFTLLEVAVALALLAVVMTLVFASVLSQRETFRVQNEVAAMQRNLSLAMKSLEKELRNAGYGLPPGVAVSVPPELTGLPAVPMVSGLGLADGGPSAPDRLCVAYVASPPTRLVRAMPGRSGELQVAEPDGWRAGDLAIVFDSRDADLFRVAHVGNGGRLAHGGPGASGPGLSKAYGEGARVARASFAGYRIETGPHPGGAALVLTKAAGAREPRPVPLAEGIEDMQVRLSRGGEERDGDRLDSDLSPLADAVGVRIRLAARSRTAAPGWSEGPAPQWNRTDVSALAPYRDHRRRRIEGRFDLRNRGIVP